MVSCDWAGYEYFFLSNEWHSLICVHTWSCNQNQSKVAVQWVLLWIPSRLHGCQLRWNSPESALKSAHQQHVECTCTRRNCTNKCSQIQKPMARGSTSTTENGPGRTQILDPWDALDYRRPNIQNTEENRFWGTLWSTPTPQAISGRLPILSTISYYISNLLIYIIYSTKQCLRVHIYMFTALICIYVCLLMIALPHHT